MNDHLKDLKSIQSGRKQLREFGLLIGGLAFFYGSYLLLLKDKGQSYTFLSIGAALIMLGILKPNFLLYPQKIWMGLAITIGWFMSRVILSLLYFGLLTPIALILKLKNIQLLTFKFDPTNDSYWTEKNVADSNYENCEKQY